MTACRYMMRVGRVAAKDDLWLGLASHYSDGVLMEPPALLVLGYCGAPECSHGLCGTTEIGRMPSMAMRLRNVTCSRPHSDVSCATVPKKAHGLQVTGQPILCCCVFRTQGDVGFLARG